MKLRSWSGLVRVAAHQEDQPDGYRHEDEHEGEHGGSDFPVIKQKTIQSL